MTEMIKHNLKMALTVQVVNPKYSLSMRKRNLKKMTSVKLRIKLKVRMKKQSKKRKNKT